jgi:dTDP-glucose 4,6-dehydratase
VTYKPAARSESDPQRRQPDIARAQRVLGWKPQVSLEEGLQKTMPYFMEELSKL